MTSTDANGIVRYETSDPVSPLHTLLNLGMASVSAAVGALSNQVVIADTGTYVADSGGVATVPYGTTIPSVLSVVCSSAFALATPVMFDVTVRTSTTFTVRLRTPAGSAVSGNFALSWIAVGKKA